MSRTDKPGPPLHSRHLEIGAYSQAAMDRLALEEKGQPQNRFLHQSRSTSSDSSAERTSTPSLKYGRLPSYRQTDPRLPPYASRSQGTTPSLKSTSFHTFRDRLIQQQWQLDQQQQWRIEQEPRGLGDFARLPLEIRRQIYIACFPSECTDVELVDTSQQRPLRNGLVSLMRTNQCIHDEIRPLIDQHAKSRLFNLVLSKKGVRFERNQFSVAFLTHENLQRMTSETIPSLDLFSRTRESIRSLRLAIQIEPTRPFPPGLIPILEPFSMWVFSLLATAEALQFLLVEFHLSHELQTTKLAHNDGSEGNVGELIGGFLGGRAAAHCRKVLNVALTSELQVVRFLVLQKDRDHRQQEKLVTSFRWNRPRQFQQPVPPNMSQQPMPQHVPQHVSQQPVTQSVSQQPLQRTEAQIITQSVLQRVSQSMHEQPVYQQPSHQSAAQLSSQSAARLSSQSASQPVAQPTVQPTVQATVQATATQPTAQSAIKQREMIPANDQLLQQVPVGERKGSPGSLQIGKDLSNVPSRSTEKLEKPFDSLSYSAPSLRFDSGPSRQCLDRRRKRELKRRRKQEKRLESHKKLKLDLGDHASIPKSVASSSKPASLTEMSRTISRPIPGQKDHTLRTTWIEKTITEEEYDVQSLRDVRTKNGISQIRVKWHGYDQMTWEPRASLMEDVPEMVKAFDKRQLRAVELGLRAKTEQETITLPQETITLPQETSGMAGISIQSPPKMIDTPQTANARTKQWTEQQGKSSPPIYSAQEELMSAPKPPKLALTPYLLYMQANRPGIWDDLCKQLGNSELATELRVQHEGTRRWNSLGDEERAVWERIYAKRLAIWHIQMEAFQAGKPIPTQDEARTLVESSNKQTTIVELT